MNPTKVDADNRAATAPAVRVAETRDRPATIIAMSKTVVSAEKAGWIGRNGGSRHEWCHVEPLLDDRVAARLHKKHPKRLRLISRVIELRLLAADKIVPLERTAAIG